MPKEYFQEYYQKHREHKKTMHAAYYLKNKSTLDAANKLYWEQRPQQRLETQLRVYNITIQEYNALFDKQQGRCAICGLHQSKFKSRLHVDHDHKTNKVRGLLCTRCNPGLGYFKDDAELLNRARAYLLRYMQ